MMMNTNLQSFPNNNGFAVPLQLNPVLYGQELGQVVPVGVLTNSFFAQPQVITTIFQDAELFISNNGLLTRSSVAEQCVESGEGTFEAPEGFSFVSTQDYFHFCFNLAQIPITLAPEIPEAKNVLSQKDLNSQQEKASPSPTKEVPLEQKKQGIKHPHRSKQKKIMGVHSTVEDVWNNKGKLAGDDEVLRGEDVLRIHVKTWEGLDLIADLLEHVDQTVPISRIALPFSMKNKFQKKGFIVYLKLESKFYVPKVQEIFGEHKDHFKKCDVALPTVKTGMAIPKDIDLDIFTPPIMTRKESRGAAA